MFLPGCANVRTLPLWRQVSRRYYNAHALVDVTLSAVFDPPLEDGAPARGARIRQPRFVISTPVTIPTGVHMQPSSKGACMWSRRPRPAWVESSGACACLVGCGVRPP